MKIRKLLKAINLRFSAVALRFLTIIITCLISTLLLLPIAEILAASKATTSFDVESGVKAATEPFVKVLDSYWGKALVLISCGGVAIERRSRIKLDIEKDKGSKE